MKKLFLIVVIALGFNMASTAQSATISKANADAVTNLDAVAGSFGYALSATETLNVNYSLSPKNPTTTANLMLHTPDPMPLSAKVMDASGKVVLSWTPANKVYLYQATLNVSPLKSGVYSVNLYMGTDKKSIHQFTFTKL
jgi:outer membrane lipoprotein-sorting protein